MKKTIYFLSLSLILATDIKPQALKPNSLLDSLTAQTGPNGEKFGNMNININGNTLTWQDNVGKGTLKEESDKLTYNAEGKFAKVNGTLDNDGLKLNYTPSGSRTEEKIEIGANELLGNLSDLPSNLSE